MLTRSYSLNSANFVDQVGKATYDIAQDEGAAVRTNKPSQLKWDRKKKKMVKTEIGADNKKLIRTESGALLPATYKSGRYEEWRKSKRGAPASTGEDVATANHHSKRRWVSLPFNVNDILTDRPNLILPQAVLMLTSAMKLSPQMPSWLVDGRLKR